MLKVWQVLCEKIVHVFRKSHYSFTYSFPSSPFSISHSLSLHPLHLLGMLLLFILPCLLQSIIFLFFPNVYNSTFCYKQTKKTTQLKKDLQRPSLPTSWVLVPQPTRCTITLYLEQLKSLFGIWKINNSKLRSMKEFS